MPKNQPADTLQNKGKPKETNQTRKFDKQKKKLNSFRLLVEKDIWEYIKLKG